MMVAIVVMIMIVIMVVVVVVVVAAVAITAVVIAAIMIIVVVMTVSRDVFAVVPIVPHKVHGAATGVVFAAVPFPMPLISRTDVQIHRLPVERRIPMNHNGTRIDQRRRLWHITDIDLAEESGLTDIEGQSQVSPQGRRGNKESGQ